jgi:hypothetical protein
MLTVVKAPADYGAALLDRELPEELRELASRLNPHVVEVGRGRRWARRRPWREAIARR